MSSCQHPYRLLTTHYQTNKFSTQLKAFADDRINVTKIGEGRTENIVGNIVFRRLLSELFTNQQNVTLVNILSK